LATDSVDQLRALPDQQITRTEDGRAGLCSLALYGDEARCAASHIASASDTSFFYRFTNHEVPIMLKNAA